MSSGKILLGLVTCIAAGAAIGILMAPDKGSATRKNLSDKAGDLKEKFDDFIESMTETLAILKATGSDISAKGKSIANDVIKTRDVVREKYSSQS